MEEVIWRVDTQEADRFFAYAGQRARNLRTPLERVGDLLLRHINLTFLTEGEWAGVVWPELSDSWFRRKAKLGYGNEPILQMTHNMIRAVLNHRNIEVHGDTLVYHVEHEYAAAHQYGGWFDAKGNQHPPERPWLVLNEWFDREVEFRFSQWIDEIHATASYFAKRSGRGFGTPGAPHPFA